MKEHTLRPAELSLDIGAGSKRIADINVDIRPLDNVDVVCNALALPFKPNCFSHVYLTDVIEHFTYPEVMRLLNEIERVLQKNGVLEITTPNFQSASILNAWITGGIDEKHCPMLYAPLSGLQDYPENLHKSQWSAKLLERYLKENRYGIVKMETTGDYSGILTFFRVLKMIFPYRGGILHAICKKERGETCQGKETIEKSGIDEILACPICKQEIKDKGEKYVCPKCKKEYPVKNGKPFLIA